jgi:hypothetical protein
MCAELAAIAFDRLPFSRLSSDSDFIWGRTGIFLFLAKCFAAGIERFEELIEKLRQTFRVRLDCDQFAEPSPAIVVNAQVLMSFHGIVKARALPKTWVQVPQLRGCKRFP